MMTSPHSLQAFREAYLEYVDGEHETPPAMDRLTDSDRRSAERWVKSLVAARGIDPYSPRPSTEELLARVTAGRKID